MTQRTGEMILITGGASGIGLAVAGLALAQGWRVAVLDRDQASLDRAAGLLAAPDRTTFMAASVADEAAIEAAIERAEQVLGPLTGVVNSAGIAVDRPALDTDAETFRRIVDVNLTGSFLVARAAARRMLAAGGGSIVNISSVSGIRGSLGRAAYGASKGAVNMLTKIMAAELGAQGIRVNAVAPGPVETPLVAEVHTPQMRQGWLDTVPQRRYGTPDEIAQAVIFLLDPAKSAYVTGQIMAVDGGFSTAGVIGRGPDAAPASA